MSNLNTVGTYFVTHDTIVNFESKDKTPNQIKTLFTQMYPSLEKADIVIDGDKITFALRDGNKA